MNRQDCNGIKFGFSLVLIWLTLLTGFVMYDKMSIAQGVRNIILPPPILEPVEMEVFYEPVNE